MKYPKPEKIREMANANLEAHERTRDFINYLAQSAQARGVNTGTVVSGAAVASLLALASTMATTNATYDEEESKLATERARRLYPDETARCDASGETLRHVMLDPETILFVALSTAAEVNDFAARNCDPEVKGDHRDLTGGVTPYRFAVNSMAAMGCHVPTWAKNLADKADQFAADAPLYMAEAAGKA